MKCPKCKKDNLIIKVGRAGTKIVFKCYECFNMWEVEETEKPKFTKFHLNKTPIFLNKYDQAGLIGDILTQNDCDEEIIELAYNLSNMKQKRKQCLMYLEEAVKTLEKIT